MNYPKYVQTNEIKCNSYNYSGNKFRFKLIIPFDSDTGRGMVRVIMKNPSTASEKECDQTVLRVCNAAKEAGYCGVIIMNLFPYRATKPSDVYKEYYAGNPDYEISMKMNLDVIKESCVNAEVVFAWGTNTISQKKEFREEYDAQIERVMDVVLDSASGAMGTNLQQTDTHYYLHGLRWWKTILCETEDAIEKTDEYIEPEKCLSSVTHHNMFGPSCEIAGVNNPKDFEIFCYEERKVCIPKKCDSCRYYAGDDMGQGRICVWSDVKGNLGSSEHVVQHSERYYEAARVFSLEETGAETEPIMVCFAMTEKQAAEEGGIECLSPSLPSPEQTYFLLDYIPDELCISKQRGWEKKICAYKYNAEEILRFLYPEETSFNKYLRQLDAIKGNRFYIMGFGD